MLIFQSDPDPFVDAAFALVSDHFNHTDFTGVGHVGPTVGLQVQPVDVDGADLLDVWGAAG